jgi:hypothetical protein
VLTIVAPFAGASRVIVGAPAAYEDGVAASNRTARTPAARAARAMAASSSVQYDL